MMTRRLLGAAVALLAASTAFMAWWLHWFGLVDLEVYRAGASAFLHGRDVYLAYPKVIHLPFTYPPFAAVVFVPLAVLPDLGARIVMSVISGAALVYAAWATLRLAAPTWSQRDRWTLACAIAAAAPLIEPIRDTFRLGQVNLVLMALVLADLVAIALAPVSPNNSRGKGAAVATSGDGPLGRRLPRGVLIGLATAVKLTPGVFILYLIAIRRPREALTAAATAVGVTLVTWALMPSDSAHYWGHLVFDDTRIGSPGNVWNQSLNGALSRLSGSADGYHVVWLALATAVLVGGLALAARLHAGGEPLVGIGVAAVTGLLVSPISWNHHWVWALPLAVGLWRQAVVTGRRAEWWLAGAWTATFCVASISWWPFTGQNDYRLGVLNEVVGDCYVLVALVVLALIAKATWTRRQIDEAVVTR